MRREPSSPDSLNGRRATAPGSQPISSLAFAEPASNASVHLALYRLRHSPGHRGAGHRGQHANRQPVAESGRRLLRDWCRDRPADYGETPKGQRASITLTRPRPSSATDRRRRRSGDQLIELAQVERLVQVGEGSLGHGIGFLLPLVVSAHHQKRRLNTKLADTLEYLEALSAE